MSTCSLGAVLATLLTAANARDAAAAGLLPDRHAAADGAPERVEAGGTHTGERIERAAKMHGVEV